MGFANVLINYFTRIQIIIILICIVNVIFICIIPPIKIFTHSFNKQIKGIS